MEPAAELAKAKGVDVVCADALDWETQAGPRGLLYADVSLGHLYDTDTGVRRVLERFKTWLREGGVLVLSVDTPWDRDDGRVQTPRSALLLPHSALPDTGRSRNAVFGT